MPFSEADQRTVLLHLEVIRSIIRGVKPEPVDVVAGGAEPKVFRQDGAVDPLNIAVSNLLAQVEEPDLDGGAACEAIRTATRATSLAAEIVSRNNTREIEEFLTDEEEALAVELNKTGFHSNADVKRVYATMHARHGELPDSVAASPSPSHLRT